MLDGAVGVDVNEIFFGLDLAAVVDGPDVDFVGGGVVDGVLTPLGGVGDDWVALGGEALHDTDWNSLHGYLVDDLALHHPDLGRLGFFIFQLVLLDRL